MCKGLWKGVFQCLLIMEVLVDVKQRSVVIHTFFLPGVGIFDRRSSAVSWLQLRLILMRHLLQHLASFSQSLVEAWRYRFAPPPPQITLLV